VKLALELRAQTTMPLAWIADRLNMHGQPGVSGPAAGTKPKTETLAVN
jgi:hypothetical protein